ncbi:hypothetical protein [Nocardioides plantarum]|uniref:Cardiolipin synthase N-terminal domain-containing protein n=1 Tax=Nocardioides plantarum TaxID=29299 RepID=A0ABV5KAX4_9ACTN|nr:hypothetical protein [Nocardioides plantarum]
MTEELDPIAPSPSELILTFSPLLIHVALVAFVVIKMLRGKATAPYGVFGFLLVFFVPIVGPLLVLIWQDRLEEHQGAAS